MENLVAGAVLVESSWIQSLRNLSCVRSIASAKDSAAAYPRGIKSRTNDIENGHYQHPVQAHASILFRTSVV